MTEMERGAWALWHPEKGFGHYIHVQTQMDDAVNDRKVQIDLDSDERWKVVPVRVFRVDHT